MYRNNKGQYISKSKKEYFVLRRFKLFCLGVACSIVLGIVAENKTVVYETPEVEASEVVPDWNPCELHSVVCENEQPVENAIKAVSDALGREVTDTTKSRIKYLYERTTEAGIPFEDAVRTIWCESQWMSVKSWLPEESYGIAQIHLPSHKVTREQALDAHFAIDFLVERWWDTKWYGYDRDTKSCTNGLTINL